MSERTGVAQVEALYRQYGPAVFRRARTLLGTEAAAADAVQDVFVRVLDRHDGFRGESSPMTWIYRITTNLCLNRLRDETRRAELRDQVEPQRSVSARRIEVTPDLRRLLERIAPEVAAAGIYHFVDGMTYEEMAEVLGVSRRTAVNLAGRFKKALQRAGLGDG